LSDMSFEPGAPSDAATTDRSDIATAILSLLAMSPDPLPVSKLKAGLRKCHDLLSVQELEALVASYVGLGTVFRHAPLRGEGFRYWDRDRGHYLDTIIERELRGAALPIHTLRGGQTPGGCFRDGAARAYRGAAAGRLHELPRAWRTSQRDVGLRLPGKADTAATRPVALPASAEVLLFENQKRI
jgi:hypothetical protein